jgi:hypothetical protein
VSKQRNTTKRAEPPQHQALTETERKRRMAQLGAVLLQIVDKMDRAGRRNGDSGSNARAIPNKDAAIDT